MHQSSAISRKRFFKIIGASVALSGLLLWDRLVGKQDELTDKGPVRHIKGPIPKGITFYEEFYVVKSDNGLKAFSTTCSHAGCLISRENNGLLICPCHGSVYDAQSGKPLKGPAMKPLRRIDCRFDPKSNEWVIRL
jgi:cytochrome b6-f complex iron-sulfur subunit